MSNSTLGSRIAGVRRTRNISQEDLAEWAGISRKHLSEIERDKSEPSAGIVAKLARGIDASLDYIMNGTGAP